MLNIVLFGPPGAGKGTQSEKLIQKYNLVHLSTGDILRSEVASKTTLGLEAKKLMDQGLLVPDEVVIGMISNKLDANVQVKGFIFDGFPRTKHQALSLDNMLQIRNMSITMMISLEVPDYKELVTRIINRGKDSGRSDDTDPSIIEQRIREYYNKTSEVKDYYYSQNKGFKANGLLSIDQVFYYICQFIDEPHKL